MREGNNINYIHPTTYIYSKEVYVTKSHIITIIGLWEEAFSYIQTYYIIAQQKMTFNALMMCFFNYDGRD